MKLILLTLCLVFTACQSTPISSPVPDDHSQDVILIDSPEPTYMPLAWEKNHPERVVWSARLRMQITQNLPAFLKAGDWSLYCSKFTLLSEGEKVDAIATMAVAIALYESSYKPASVYHEPPPLSVDSIGLYQLSYEDKMKWCDMDRQKGNLIDPLVNIDCAIPEMASLIVRDKVVAAGQKKGTRQGLARYWSVMWPTGHLSDIRKAVQSLSFCK